MNERKNATFCEMAQLMNINRADRINPLSHPDR